MERLSCDDVATDRKRLLKGMSLYLNGRSIDGSVLISAWGRRYVIANPEFRPHLWVVFPRHEQGLEDVVLIQRLGQLKAFVARFFELQINLLDSRVHLVVMLSK